MAWRSHLGSRSREDSPAASSEAAQSSPLAMAWPSHLGSRSREDSPAASQTTGVTSVSTRNENFGQSSKERERGETYKRRKTRHIQVMIGTEELQGLVDDGYIWRKYGQKDVPGAQHPRSYYRCTHRGTRGCLATKQEQRSDQNPSILDVSYRGSHTCQQRQPLVSPRREIEQRDSQELHSPILVPCFTAPPWKNQEFASSLKVLGWFVQMLSDKSLTATLQHWGVIADKPDLSEALQSLLDELDSVQVMLSIAQNFGSQQKGLLEFLKNLMDAAYDADDLLSEVDYYRLEQQVNDSEDEDLLTKVDYHLQKASVSSTPPSFHDINKSTIVPRIHQSVSQLEGLVTCLSKALSLLEPEEGLRANPNVFPVASHPPTTTFRLFSISNEFLSMFNVCAFGGEDPSDHLGLGEIAKQIAGKLDGSSLAARIVGGLLRDNLDEQHWTSVLCSDIWQQRRSPDDIMPILRFSYGHLPAHLQQCFAYCGIFPKNQSFIKEDLVGMWISQGYIHTKSGGNMSPEELGCEYFDHLETKSFIQLSNMGMFVLHELLYDLAESVSEDECLRIITNGTKKITSRVRHIYAHVSSLGLLKSCNLSNLRTLIIYRSYGDDHIDDNVLKEVLNRLKGIRVLSLRDVSVQLLWGSIGHLIHLRYLSVGASSQNMPSDSHCRPYHLQWLILTFYDRATTKYVLPTAMNCLVSLRHFNSGNVKLSGIGKLTHLQELESFTVGKKEGQKFGELKSLNELGGTLKLLSIQSASTKEEALEANLYKKIGIQELELSCFGGSHASAQMAEEVFEGLRPPPYIKKLTLYGYNGVKSPSWMVTENHCLSYLQFLHLSYCRSWKVLPTLGELPLLRHLQIDGANSVEEIGSSFYGSVVAKAFPCLDTLHFSSMPELVVWWSAFELKDTSGPVVSSGGKETCPFFPCLRNLTLTDCPRLERVPIQHMTSVEVIETDCLLLLKELENLTSLQELSIQCCTELVSVELKRLPSLEKLTIWSCDRIQSVPLLPPTLKWLQIYDLEMLTAFSVEQEENLSDLTSLKYVSIYGCPNLRSLPIMPASLQHLSINKCPELPRERYEKGGDEWHKISHVSEISWQKG